MKVMARLASAAMAEMSSLEEIGSCRSPIHPITCRVFGGEDCVASFLIGTSDAPLFLS